jgi:hypothetical protein
LRNERRKRSTDRRSWTPADLEKVKLLFPNKRSLEKALPRRTWVAILAQAGILGLRKKQNRWLACDVSKLRRMWTAGATNSEIREALPRYSWNQIRWQARGRKFSRPKKSPASTGHPVIDQIKERARYLNLSMGDVDAMSGTKGYFYAARWLNTPRPSLKAVGKAIRALDGELAAVWH